MGCVLLFDLKLESDNATSLGDGPPPFDPPTALLSRAASRLIMAREGATARPT